MMVPSPPPLLVCVSMVHGRPAAAALLWFSPVPPAGRRESCALQVGRVSFSGVAMWCDRMGDIAHHHISYDMPARYSDNLVVAVSILGQEGTKGFFHGPAYTRACIYMLLMNIAVVVWTSFVCLPC